MTDRLLFADGDDALLDVYQRYFTGLGYAVQTACTGLVCVACLRQQCPDLLIAGLPSLRASAPAQGCSTAIRARVALAAREHAATDATGPRLRGYHGRTFGFWLDFRRRDRPRHGVSAPGGPQGS